MFVTTIQNTCSISCLTFDWKAEETLSSTEDPSGLFKKTPFKDPVFVSRSAEQVMGTNRTLPSDAVSKFSRVYFTAASPCKAERTPIKSWHTSEESHDCETVNCFSQWAKAADSWNPAPRWDNSVELGHSHGCSSGIDRNHKKKKMKTWRWSETVFVDTRTLWVTLA